MMVSVGSRISHQIGNARNISYFRRFLQLSIVLFAVFQVQLFLVAQSESSIAHNNLQNTEIRRLQNKKKDCSASGLLALSSPHESNLRRSSNSPRQSSKKPCALLFFGLAKQFRSIVLPSIQEHILNFPENAQCDIYAHTYDITNVTSSSHQEEIGISMDPMEIYDLTSNVVIDTNADFEAKRDLKHLMHKLHLPTSRVGWSANSLLNMYKQWHSIERVWDLMEESEKKMGVEYERVAMFRSDVKYMTPINIFDGGDAVIPKFGFLVNDRMFYGARENARIWSKIRFASMANGCYRPRHGALGMHSEFFMKDFVVERIIAKVSQRDDICFYRVRGNGSVLEDDCTKKYEMPPFLVKAGLV